MRNQTPKLLLCRLLFLLLGTEVVCGGVLYSTLGPGQTFSGNAIQISTFGSSAHYYQAVAQSFVPSQTAMLGSIQIPLVLSSGVNAFTIRLASDNAGLPGAVLESFTITGVQDFPGAIQTVNSSANPLLLRTRTYWLEVLPGGSTSAGGWFTRDDFPNYGSTILAIDHGSGWYASGSGTGPQAFQINSVVVPEPQLVSFVSIIVFLHKWPRLRRS